MAIKKIKISNFKSFESLDIELGDFNVLIGANASGKSNFIQIFRFLRDIASCGLDNAISLQGGSEYLRNINIDLSEIVLLEVVSEQSFGYGQAIGYGTESVDERKIEVKINEVAYRLGIKFNGAKSKLEISDDEVTLKCQFFIQERQKEEGRIEQGEIVLTKVNGAIEHNFEKVPDTIPKFFLNALCSPFFKEEEGRQTLLFQTQFFCIPPLEYVFKDISIYDFDPKLPKKAAPIAGKAELEEDGSNLALVLKNIVEDEDKKRKFSNLIKDLLPFVEDLDTEKFAGKSIFFKLRESYFDDQYLPAFLLSDGTINIAALIIALYFEKKPLVIIEEPERNIHPYLISKVVDMMKDASQQKQIMVTTHNPEVVKHAGLENIFLVSRDKDGFSTISRPGDKEEVKTFLKNDIGIDELYVQNFLESAVGGGPTSNLTVTSSH